MLLRPEKGFARSTNKNNVGKSELADWIEASCFLLQERVSKSDIVDVLVEEQICDDDDQDLAHQIADIGFEEVAKRLRLLGSVNAVERKRDHFLPMIDIEDEPLYAFFLTLSISRIYPDWARDYSDYSYQGDLFERVVECLCPGILPGWTTYRAGWSPENTVSIGTIVDELCPRLNTRGHPNLAHWVPNAAKDGGLDLVCYRNFDDGKEALPTFLIQCASGANWRTKVATPSGNAWKTYLDSAVVPSTAIAAPFVITDEELRFAGLEGQVIVFDRARLLQGVVASNENLTDDLLDEIFNFVTAYLHHLPLAA